MADRKLTNAQKNDLIIAYNDAMEQDANSYHAAHMLLMSKLNGWGFSVMSKEDALRVSEDILWGRV